MEITLTSSAFKDGELIPRQFTCDGDNVPPPLSWSPGPPRTRSYALTVEDFGGEDDIFTYWVLYDIPVRASAWPNDYGGKTLLNSFGRSGYGGPCPPSGSGSHRYVFRIHALDVRYLELADARLDALRKALSTHAIGVGLLVGLYTR